MIPNYKNIKNSIKINGVHLDKEALFQLAYSSIKEGKKKKNNDYYAGSTDI